MTTTVAVAGASGKLGSLITGIIDGFDDFELVAALGSSSALSDLDGVDLVVDVTTPAVSPAIVERAVASGSNVLVGTSGWSSARLAELGRRLEGTDRGVVVIPNFSLGSVLATSLATVASRFFESIEILEAHRATKVDSPSGTAVRTAELMAAARADAGPVEAPHIDQRARGQQVTSIPVHSMRLRGVVAKQDVVFGGDGETLTITHETIEPSAAYDVGIRLALPAARDARGLIVGLESLVDLGIALPGRS
ncbi:4-hydroxy-tetrahydrodipicolinate reductase [Labedella phragmitis]|uniref:4-hydroxy-tetrahydrodipicolinate reductase n=1 Tax=Labedella phragmitis TaxID=2498849 RepID=A0A444PPZ5_9MICO|nr:4-hydroxy-tetrahydrodipicolinate reductase [Labedella phragmitis]RWZ46501.1 4-hydroxy-tetrahydrodipicolinate reductase [Labedella phragmitis]